MRNELMNRNNDMANWFDDFGNMFNRLGSFPKVNMKSDISETKDTYDVKIDMPDMDKKDIKLSYKDNQLFVTGKRDSFSDHEDDKGNVLMSERSYGQFSRSFNLPNVDEKKISANYKNGTLNIKLPKSEKVEDDSGLIKID